MFVVFFFVAQFMLVRAGTIPPMVDSRDAFRKRFQGPGRRVNTPPQQQQQDLAPCRCGPVVRCVSLTALPSGWGAPAEYMISPLTCALRDALCCASFNRRKDFMSRHRVRLFRTYLFFSHDLPSLIDQVMEARSSRGSPLPRGIV